MANACEEKQVLDETLPICEEYQVSTEKNPCKKVMKVLAYIL
jgi:hypothetical protein